MKKLISVITYVTIFTGILLFSFKITRGSINNENTKKTLPLGTFILHDDFGNLMWEAESDQPGEYQENIETNARLSALSGADFISLYCTGKGSGIDPWGIAAAKMRRQGIPVLAKFRMNDRHHIWRRQKGPGFWRDHPEWRIGHTERNVDMVSWFISRFKDHPYLGPEKDPASWKVLVEERPQLLDYAVAEVREKNLAIIREVVESYDVAGVTLNMIREEYLISFPEKNGVFLTEFVRQTRRIVDEVLGAKGINTPILGVILPWDIDYCRAMGMEIDIWITEGLIDYVSPSDSWNGDFNIDIQPWVELARGTRCSVLPAFHGLMIQHADFCLPGEYRSSNVVPGRRRYRPGSALIMPEHVRALAHRFYADGTDGLSSFNLHQASHYGYLAPLSDLISPDNLDAGDRSYLYLKIHGYTSANFEFLQLHLSFETPSHYWWFRMREDLSGSRAYLRFKARGLEDVADMAVLINDRKLPSQRLKIIPHDGEGFLYLQYQLEPDDIQDGDNELGFLLTHLATPDIIVQEIEIRVHP